MCSPYKNWVLILLTGTISVFFWQEHTLCSIDKNTLYVLLTETHSVFSLQELSFNSSNRNNHWFLLTGTITDTLHNFYSWELEKSPFAVEIYLFYTPEGVWLSILTSSHIIAWKQIILSEFFNKILDMLLDSSAIMWIDKITYYRNSQRKCHGLNIIESLYYSAGNFIILKCLSFFRELEIGKRIWKVEWVSFSRHAISYSTF